MNAANLPKRNTKLGTYWVEIVILLELSKKIKSDQTTKGYMHKAKSIQENETSRFCGSGRPQNKGKRKLNDKYSEFDREQKKSETKVTVNLEQSSKA